MEDRKIKTKIIRVLGCNTSYQVYQNYTIEIHKDNTQIHFMPKNNLVHSQIQGLCNRIKMNSHCMIHYFTLKGLMITFYKLDNAEEMKSAFQ